MENETDLTVKECKTRMRRAAIARRKTVGEAERTEAGKKLMNQVQKLVSHGKHATDAFPSDTNTEANAANGDRCNVSLSVGASVAAYVSMGTEVPTLPLLEWLLSQELRVLVPRLGRGRDIGWSEYSGENGLQEMPRNAAGGLRPKEPYGKVLGAQAIEEATIVFIPAFAIDLDGLRLGRGGGWYDQVLGFCRPDALKIGVCWDWEFIDQYGAVPRESHDIPVDAVVTDKRIIGISKKNLAINGSAN
ncbi:5-formyltetrahydrofolate cyclo-ligase [Bifidobacterium sp. ESL0682]|uniref:5-formyltetrahydrofolate cyclo-ligase n=1 Tax=Bifidobacterium sp. ESL0682 TaxID=2983212 RepID=UPI0023F6A406|nr:5-formyltetrahydrofolate cyclo-ligase [Bifidobacterium sp. ESL0682]WEV42298.1 5-formyltetrahydrofolate cyclo-ligase [Bifidobacterium sp. ESL0682]